jgi:hypothetical protein
MILYKVGLHSGAAAVTSKVDNVRAFLNREPAGRYEIEALTRRSLWMSCRSSQQWGFAIKHDDGHVELLLADGSRHAGPKTLN